ncbi:MAG: tRNA pseudouridine(13) synthase TruD [Deltaproteobacteria bacterium]|nr:tRNA pseudouridine(13) synthase TruD [Deltaproteobacteria bacterium]
MSLPYLTAAIPGIGGRLRAEVDDFAVDEIPAYEPTGTGEHVFVWIEKRDLPTMVAATMLARAVGCAPRDVGYAGLKDKRAVTRQWLSLPPPTTPEQVRALELPGITILDARRHGHKLRTGHLRGNRFRLRVRGVAPDAIDRATAILGALAEPPGALNWYGEQRFGRAGDNAARGRAILAGTAGRINPREKRLFISALQSELFNQWLVARVNDGLLRRVIPGDWLEKRGSGGSFSTTEPAVDEARVASGELVVTGPMYGWKLRQAAPDTQAGEREAAILAAAGLTLADFRPAGDLAFGTRRALAIAITDPACVACAPDALDVSFTLAAGAYATAVIRELMKNEGNREAADPAEPATDAPDPDQPGD